MLYRVLIASFFFLSSTVQADDTELFIADLSGEKTIRPQVLIIFDNSGSMKSNEVSKVPFDPKINYTDSTDIYYGLESWKGWIPPFNNRDYRFSGSINNCKSSEGPLTNTGKYSGNLVAFYGRGYNRWYSLAYGGGSVVDCKDDVLNSITENKYWKDGYPKNSSQVYSNQKNYLFGNDSAATLYSADYAYWNQYEKEVRRSRLAIAKEAITGLVKGTPSVDFGLAIFNHGRGGRIASKVQKRYSAEQNKKNEDANEETTKETIESFTALIDGLIGDTATPLTQTMYESYLYYSGNSVKYAKNLASNDIPGKDSSAETSGVYNSPFQECQESASIILMTDGQPNEDADADDEIQTLAGVAEGFIYGQDSRNRDLVSYMPALAKWMNNDDVSSLNGAQNITTYTIGFGQAAIDSAGTLLTETAKQGGGKYFPAKSASELQSAFDETILTILNTSSGLTSPAVANSNFDKTRSLDSIYFSMFLPTNKPVWQGNIKKLKLDNKGVLRDKNNKAAIGADGNIKTNASTYWGNISDGDKVEQGGVTAMLSTVTSRTILSNISGAVATLSEPSKSNLVSHYKLTGTDAEKSTALAAELAVAEDKLDETLNWLLGKDVLDVDKDGATDDYRNDIFSDPLHSSPLAIPYIKKEINKPDKEVVSLLVGTNAGFLHMFTDEGETVSENWAFIPEQLLKYGIALKNAAPTSGAKHSYGMDSPPMVIKTYDADGALEKRIAVVGMRRGGSSYYALDITNPATPSFMWQINGQATGVTATSGFEELGQTWSVPVSGKLTYKDGTQTKTAPVIVFGGGYDTNKDSCTPSSNDDGNSIETCNDSRGRAIYIVNALTGDRVWSLVGGSCPTGDKHCLHDSSLQDSIPAEVAVMDSDGDENIDRIYAGDTGGNVWRADLVGTDTSKWTNIKLAELGGDTSETDRRFFTAPVIARTYKGTNIPYDGVLMGSGDRAKPVSNKTTVNAFYLLHDYKISPTLFEDDTKPTPIKADALHELRGDSTQAVTIGESSGWQYIFNQNSGEKSLGKASLLNGTIYFTSFTPNSLPTTCGNSNFGQGWLYAVNIHSGANQLQKDGVTQEKMAIGARIPDALVIHSGVNEVGNNVIRLLGVGQGDEITIVDDASTPEDESETINSGTIDTNTNMMPRRIYSYFEEPLWE
ncbi:pilus assembly protein [Psychromonas aquimarina]|uniref:pilus assembly protein n=1 Tax=Psychromonas aquimarina TaxID=444919 RepID=UPI000427C131|nr:PilC/PilY family type IV pilus protein [Psychromonas aquimarina]